MEAEGWGVRGWGVRGGEGGGRGGEGRGSCSGLMTAVSLLCCGHTLPPTVLTFSVQFRETRNYTNRGLVAKLVARPLEFEFRYLSKSM